MRKPNGKGRLAVQKNRRKALSVALGKALLKVLDVDKIEKTGDIFPRLCDLRKIEQRRQFGFLKTAVKERRVYQTTVPFNL